MSGVPSSVTSSSTDPEALFDPATILDQLRLRTLIGSPAARLDGLHHRVSEMVDKDGCEPGVGLFCRGKIPPNGIIAQAVGVWISTWESNKLLAAGLGGYTIHWCNDDPTRFRRGRQLYCRATNMDNIDIANCANGAAGMFRADESGVMRAVRPNADLYPDRTNGVVVLRARKQGIDRKREVVTPYGPCWRQVIAAPPIEREWFYGSETSSSESSQPHSPPHPTDHVVSPDHHLQASTPSTVRQTPSPTFSVEEDEEEYDPWAASIDASSPPERTLSPPSGMPAFPGSDDEADPVSLSPPRFVPASPVLPATDPAQT